MPLKLHAMERALRHLKRLHSTPSTDELRRDLLTLQSLRMGRLVQIFMEYVWPPGDIPTFPSPLAERTPLQLSEYAHGLGHKSDVPPIVSLQLASDLLETYFQDYVHLFTDGSVDPTRSTATAAYSLPCPSLKIEGAAWLNFYTTSTSAELCAIWLGHQGLLHHCQPTKAAVLTDSRNAIQLLGNANESTLLAPTVAKTCHDTENVGRTLVFQWVHSHVGLPWNAKADALASAAYQDYTPTFFLRRFAEAKQLIKAIVNLRHPDHRVAWRAAPCTILSRQFSRSNTSLLYRLRTDSAFN